MKFVRYWVPVIVWMSGIFLLSSQQSIGISEEKVVNFIVFKLLHILEYGILYVLLFRAIHSTKNALKLEKKLFITFLIAVIFSATDEIHQTFVPTREGAARDVIIDAIGIVTAWICIQRLLPKAPKKLLMLVSRWQLL